MYKLIPTRPNLLSQVQYQLDNKQFVVARKSTNHTLVYFMHVFLESLDREGMYAKILFIDFSKGFDLVDHRALLHELEVLGVHDAIVRWIGAFLVDRQERVRITGQLPSSISPHGGIQHGTRLAPLLFVVLVNGVLISSTMMISPSWNLFSGTLIAICHCS